VGGGSVGGGEGGDAAESFRWVDTFAQALVGTLQTGAPAPAPPVPSLLHLDRLRPHRAATCVAHLSDTAAADAQRAAGGGSAPAPVVRRGCAMRAPLYVRYSRKQTDSCFLVLQPYSPFLLYLFSHSLLYLFVNHHQVHARARG